MRTLRRYLIGELLKSLALTLTVYTGVLVLADSFRLLGLLVLGNARLADFLQVILLMFPYLIALALPVGLLTSVLLVFGRFSADQEFTAAKSGGISLVALALPVLGLSLAMTALEGVIHLQVAPWCGHQLKRVVARMAAQSPMMLLLEKSFLTELPNHVIYIERKRVAAGQTNVFDLEGLLVNRLESGTLKQRTRAAKGRVTIDEATQELLFTLYDAQVFVRSDSFSTNAPTREMSDDWIPIAGGELNITVPLTKASLAAPKPSIDKMTFSELHRERALRESHGIDTLPVRVQIQSKVSFSFSCLAFTLIGIPLAIRAQRRETTIGIALAILVMGVYYGLMLAGLSLSGKPAAHPEWLVWVPTFLCQAVGALLLWRTHRRG
ncbi:MAG: YjgP/YjgQ family permease [Pedosphaera sp.]|nr:YjgP/YjgQ family permease [Pedosphaera sp.]